MWNKRGHRRQRGVTLVELIVALVIVGVGLAGLIAAFTRTSVNSADPMIRKQMGSVAEGMMEEVLLKPFAADATAASTRDSYNDIWDFNGYTSNGIKTVSGDSIPGLENYSVAVSVAATSLTNVPAGDAALVSVTVTYAGQSLTLYGWRTKA